jgi:methyltransferase-like protein
MLGAVRDMMCYHTRHIAEPRARAAEARALLDFLAKAIPTENTPHASFLNICVNYVKERLLPKDDAFLLHDELSEVNDPLYFYQFAERAERHGLQYLADAQFQTMLLSDFPQEVSEALQQMAQDTIALEQYMDFLRNRTFRQSLLCHQTVQLDVTRGFQSLTSFYVASPALPAVPELDIRSAAVETFHVADGAALSTDHPVTKAAMLHLAEIWPQAVPFKTLLDTAYARLNGALGDTALHDTASDAQVMGANLLKAYGHSDKLVELHVYEPFFVLEISERPVASPVARWQAQRDARITNLRHERVKLDPISYHLLPYLDGRRDCVALLDVLEAWAAQGTIEVQRDDEPLRCVLVEVLNAKLDRLARAALLVG